MTDSTTAPSASSYATCYRAKMDQRNDIERDADAFIESQRIRRLWFVRADFRPTNTAERLEALAIIERHGDRAAFARASELKRWLSHHSNSTSVSS
jgi:hypothetical protein